MEKVVLHTRGDGYWSSEKRSVTITDMKLSTCWGDDIDWSPDGYIISELRVYFDDTWRISEHGLIYTDSLFLKELRKFLYEHGLPGKSVDYSEQGMQGDDYVSLDAEKKFYTAWIKKGLKSHDN